MKNPARKRAAAGLSRRTLLAATLLIPGVAACSRVTARREPDFAAIEAASGGRIGVAAVDLASGRVISHRPDERFAMCSTFKWLLAALVLHRVDRNEEHLSRRITFGAGDLVVYSPLTEPGARQGGMTVGALCSAAVSHSDNTAANLLLATLGGPAGFTARVREFGDSTTRLDRLEPLLNENAPDDPRDTTTPRAMLDAMRLFLFSDVLTERSRDTLRGWMIASRTGLSRLRAGLPQGWIAGDKTGTSSNDQSNDVAFALPPESDGRDIGPIIVVSFLHAPDPFGAQAKALHASVAREAVRALL